MSAMPPCPKCKKRILIIKSGFHDSEKTIQRYKCKDCDYHFSVNKMGKEVDPYYKVKAVQLYLEGISAKRVGEIIGVSHDVISRWLKGMREDLDKIRLSTEGVHEMNSEEGTLFYIKNNNLKSSGVIVDGDDDGGGEVWGVRRVAKNTKSMGNIKVAKKINVSKSKPEEEEDRGRSEERSSEDDFILREMEIVRNKMKNK